MSKSKERLLKGSKFKEKGCKEVGKRELGIGQITLHLKTWPHPLTPPPSGWANRGLRGMGSGAGQAEPAYWPESLCPCIYAAGALHGREFHLQSLCHHGGDRDERQNYPKPPHWVRFSPSTFSVLPQLFCKCLSSEGKNHGESGPLTPNNSDYVIKAVIWGFIERKCSICILEAACI